MDQIESCIPPGFRFHPTEEELVGYYLKRKVNSQKFDLNVIIDIDLYRMEPWQIQEKCSKLGNEEDNEWYFFSYKDRKYPTGSRTNRATSAGFWKATGRDKAVLSNDNIIGMRKTLVYYKGRAPNGQKSDWIMHEYRLQTTDHAPVQEEGWVVCRAFKKPTPSHNQGIGPWNNHNYNTYYPMRNTNTSNTNFNNTSRLLIGSSSTVPTDLTESSHQPGTTSTTNIQPRHDLHPFGNHEQDYFTSINNITLMDLPDLDSPTISTNLANKRVFDQQMSCGDMMNNIEDYDHEKNNTNDNNKWENVDSLLGSSQVHEATTSSWFSDTVLPNLQLGDYELEGHNQMSCFLGSFPNL